MTRAQWTDRNAELASLLEELRLEREKYRRLEEAFAEVLRVRDENYLCGVGLMNRVAELESDRGEIVGTFRGDA